MSMTDLFTALTMMGGASTLTELRTKHVPRHSIMRAINGGQALSLGNGKIALHSCEFDMKTAVKYSATLTCVTGALQHQLWVYRKPHQPHLLVDRGATRVPEVIHRGRRHGRLDTVNGCVARALRCLPELEALVIAESAIVQGKLTIDDLLARFTGQRDKAARALIAQVDVKSMSLLETITRYWLVQAGFQVTSQAFSRRLVG